MARLRLVVLVSGRGSNLESLLAASRAGALDADVVLVVSNKPDAPALDVAARAGVPTRVVPSAGLAREEHDRRVAEAIDEARADLVLLAGYMRILGGAFIARYRGRLLNIHPSLLPAFPGVDAQGQAHARGVRVAGCTVHFVTEDVDAGPILAQAALAVDPAWSADELRARILELEHRLYPACVRLLAAKRARLEGDRVVFEAAPPPAGALFSVEGDE
ncbi:MAG TPA: phosphoribosylglycinamide formyltransferase [Candidatus Thermoplasmatota archaeon]|nr:phosphoribosylglycinamide formyltransferase [Candidatus Thermoplasmatota archaeon]